MSMSKSLLACLVVVLVMVMGSPVMASLLPNGDFESVTGGVFDSWTIQPATSGSVALPSTSPAVFSGTYSAACLYGTADGGYFKGKFADVGLSDFQVDLDFACFNNATTSGRTFAIAFAGDDAMVSMTNSIRIGPSNKLGYLDFNAGWQVTNLVANITADTGTAKYWDGEAPMLNHLTICAHGYGTDNYSTDITFNGSSFSYMGHLTAALNVPTTTIAFFGQGCVSDFLVDNVTVAAIDPIPEPGVLTLAFTGLIGLVCYAWRKRK